MEAVRRSAYNAIQRHTIVYYGIQRYTTVYNGMQRYATVRAELGIKEEILGDAIKGIYLKEVLRC